MAKKKRVERGEGWELIKPCPSCGRPPAACCCPAEPLGPSRAPGVRLERRRGRDVTVVTGLGFGEKELGALAADLKRKLGVGGTVKGGAIELQGDRRAEVERLLSSRENPVNPSGFGAQG